VPTLAPTSQRSSETEGDSRVALRPPLFCPGIPFRVLPYSLRIANKRSCRPHLFHIPYLPASPLVEVAPCLVHYYFSSFLNGAGAPGLRSRSTLALLILPSPAVLLSLPFHCRPTLCHQCPFLSVSLCFFGRSPAVISPPAGHSRGPPSFHR